MFDNRLRHVVAVARLSSFTKAAESLGLTQSAITKSVAEAERQLGYPIFFRTSRGARMTEEGRQFVETAGRILTDVDDLFARTKRDGDRFAGVLRIGISPASLEWMLIEPCVRLLKLHESVKLEMVSGSVERMAELLRQGQIDLAFGPADVLRQWPEFRCEPMTDVTLNLFVKKDHPLTVIKPLGPTDLANFEFVVPLPMQPSLGAVSAIYEAAGHDWTRKVHMIDYFPAVERLVLEFGLVGIVAKAYAATKRFSGRFAVLGQPELFEPLLVCCAYRRRWVPKPAATAFIRVARTMWPPAKAG
jgi:DNA-binding transcriptional LysR family regulator